jgi:hypothetical protein
MTLITWLETRLSDHVLVGPCAHRAVSWVNLATDEKIPYQ